MFFWKVTYSAKYRRASIYNNGCNLRCPGCTYRLRPPAPRKPLSLDAIESTLRSLELERVHFLGGEPALNPDLPHLLEFCKRKLGVTTWLGHTNGWRLPLPYLDGANVGFKSTRKDVALSYTGASPEVVFSNFKAAYEAGLQLKANLIYIPGLVENDQVEELARFLADCDPAIPLHINGFYPPPGVPWRKASEAEVAAAVEVARRYLQTVTSAVADISGNFPRDDRFDVITVLKAA